MLVFFVVPAVFTAQCYAERGVATAKLSVHDVEISWSHRLEIFKSNFMVSSAGVQHPTSWIYSKGSRFEILAETVGFRRTKARRSL